MNRYERSGTKNVYGSRERENMDCYGLLAGIVLHAEKQYRHVLTHPKKRLISQDPNAEDLQLELEYFFKKWPWWDYLGMDGVETMMKIRKSVGK